MAFCGKCGAELLPNARFCGKCGAPVTPPAAPQAAPAQAAPAQAAPGQVFVPNAQPVPMPYQFSRIPVRHRCVNGHVTDGPEGIPACPTCGAPYQEGGIIHLYRMGNFSGMAVGMAIYINGQPYGHIANKGSIRISLPYGQYMVHVTHTTTRSCNDPVFLLTPQSPYICCKAHFSKAGFAITVEPAAPESMPTA